MKDLLKKILRTKTFSLLIENKKIFFDLPGSISFRLHLQGIRNIQSLNKCTFSEQKIIFHIDEIKK